MTPDPTDPFAQEIHTLGQAKQLVLKHAMGLVPGRVKWNGVPATVTMYDAFAGRKEPSLPLDVALRIIRREVLFHNVSISWSHYRATIILFMESGMPLPPEQFENDQLQQFCLRILELCAAWEGVDQHLDR